MRGPTKRSVSSSTYFSDASFYLSRLPFFLSTPILFRVTKFLIFFQAEDDLNEIDPTAIVGRRTRGVKVDYTSKEALEKAGLQGNEKDEDSDEDVEMKEA